MNIAIPILAVICVALLAWAMEERRKRTIAEDRYQAAKVQRDQAVERFESYLNRKMARDDAFEDANLQRQGIPIPGKPIEPPKKRDTRAIGGAARVSRMFRDQIEPVEPPRTVGPTNEKVS